MALKWLVLVLGFLGLAAIETSPWLAHVGIRLGAQGTDAVHHLWILAWDVHALGTQPLRLFDVAPPLRAAAPPSPCSRASPRSC